MSARGPAHTFGPRVDSVYNEFPPRLGRPWWSDATLIFCVVGGLSLTFCALLVCWLGKPAVIGGCVTCQQF